MGFLILLLFFILASPALAQPPERGVFIAGMSAPVVICDTADQITAIAVAGRSSGIAMREVYGTLNALRDTGEPACGYQPINGVVAGDRIDLGLTHVEGGELRRVWALEVSDPDHSWWIMLTEPDDTI